MKSYKMAAAELFVSVDTIKSYTLNIYVKLQVRSGTNAVSKATSDEIV
jgi:DNA-binding NarL/FixJ family response regulator